MKKKYGFVFSSRIIALNGCFTGSIYQWLTIIIEETKSNKRDDWKLFKKCLENTDYGAASGKAKNKKSKTGPGTAIEPMVAGEKEHGDETLILRMVF